MSVLGINLFPANYWVLDLGKDYDYAVVGDPKLSSGWILSRNRKCGRKNSRE
ncbi:lipocalin family protein [Candidatus Bipolaricaulota bacterium]|nr:lipocalin family protein [Candidatus Bipolaricaulota bacterium]MBS3791615.1 lipocalin family protein [Candidatus Bipolaricaulota bacterium]